MSTSEILVRVLRAGIGESLHRGHIAVADSGGQTLYFAGDPDCRTFARSSAKPIQAIPVIESGAASQFALTDQEIAVICASHNGEDEHVREVESILRKIGKTADRLQCGAHDPYHKETAEQMKKRQESPTALHNNCSGKHAGMLAIVQALGLSDECYTSADHPVQQRMLEAVAEMSGEPADRIALGVDGCGVPVFGLPLAKLAAAYARMGAPDALPASRADACKRIIAALRSHPSLLAGKDRFDTRLIEATHGRIVGKMGAEGVFALTVPQLKLGLAVKIEDGAQRALYPVVVEALHQLNWLNEDELNILGPFHRPAVFNWRGDQVGVIEPDFRLHSISS